MPAPVGGGGLIPAYHCINNNHSLSSFATSHHWKYVTMVPKSKTLISPPDPSGNLGHIMIVPSPCPIGNPKTCSFSLGSGNFGGFANCCLYFQHKWTKIDVQSLADRHSNQMWFQVVNYRLSFLNLLHPFTHATLKTSDSFTQKESNQAFILDF